MTLKKKIINLIDFKNLLKEIINKLFFQSSMNVNANKKI